MEGYEDALHNIAYAIESLASEKQDDTLDLKQILERIALKMDHNRKNAETIKICFYADPTQTEFQVCLTKHAREARVFLPIKIFSLLQYVSQPMLEAAMSNYNTPLGVSMFRNMICFFDPQWNLDEKRITCSVWWNQFGECLVKRLCHQHELCNGAFEVVCDCIQHVCSAHLHLIKLPSECPICCKPYSIQGPKFKRIKTGE